MGELDYSKILAVFDLLIAGSPLLPMVLFLPMTIYDNKKGEYKGFLRPLAIFWLAVAAAGAWRSVEISTSPIFNPWGYAVFAVLFTILGARVMVEEVHKLLFGEWMHKKGIWLLKKSDETG